MSAPTLLPFQEDGAKHLALKATAALADPMRMGKTPQTIRAADVVNAKRVLVVCPAIATENWRRQWLRWQQVERTVGIVTGRGTVPETDVVIVSYDRLNTDAAKRLYPYLRKRWDVLVCDEAHYLKDRKSKRTRAIYGTDCDRKSGFAALAKRVWLLSGTLAPNHPGELWTHTRALWPDAIPEYLDDMAFEQRYCRVGTGYQERRKILGGRNLDELRERLSPFVLRREFEDVMPEMPPILVDTLPVDPSTYHGTDALKRLESSEEFLALARVLDAAQAENLPPEQLDNALMEAIAHVESEYLSTLNRLTGVVKAEVAVDLVSQELTGNKDKIVLFAIHREVIDRLAGGLAKFGVEVIDGRTPQARRQPIIDRFQSDPSRRVMVGQITAAGTAVEMWAARSVLLVEASWVPADNAQAIARAQHRERREPLLARFLSLSGSLDDVKQRVLARKASTVRQIFS